MEAQEKDSTGPLLVLRHVKLVNGRLWTKTPELEVDLSRVLASAGDHMCLGNLAQPRLPSIPHGDENSTVSCGVNKTGASKTYIHNILSVDVFQLSFPLLITTLEVRNNTKNVYIANLIGIQIVGENASV